MLQATGPGLGFRGNRNVAGAVSLSDNDFHSEAMRNLGKDFIFACFDPGRNPSLFVVLLQESNALAPFLAVGLGQIAVVPDRLDDLPREDGLD